MNHSYRGTKGIVQGSLESKWAPWARAQHEEKLVGWNIEYQGWPISNLQGKLKNLEEKRSQENTILNRMIVEDELLLVEKVLTQKLLKKEEGKGKPKAPPPPVPPPPQGDQPQPKGLPEGKTKKKRAVVGGQIVEYEIEEITLNRNSTVIFPKITQVGGHQIVLQVDGELLYFDFPPNDLGFYVIIDGASRPSPHPAWGGSEPLNFYTPQIPNALTREQIFEHTDVNFRAVWDKNWEITIYYYIGADGQNYIYDLVTKGIVEGDTNTTGAPKDLFPLDPSLPFEENQRRFKMQQQAEKEAKIDDFLSKGLTPEQAKAKVEEEEAKAEERKDNEIHIKDIMSEIGIPYDDVLDTLPK